jgi:hypothetical protein
MLRPPATDVISPTRDVGYLPPRPIFGLGSSAVVVACDRIRSELDGREGCEEFYWFMREYPRCYRFHMSGADFRLRSVYHLMRELRSELSRDMSSRGEGAFELAISNIRVSQIYWDFESFLSEISIALDLLARVVGPVPRAISAVVQSAMQALGGASSSWTIQRGTKTMGNSHERLSRLFHSLYACRHALDCGIKKVP